MSTPYVAFPPGMVTVMRDWMGQLGDPIMKVPYTSMMVARLRANGWSATMSCMRQGQRTHGGLAISSVTCCP